LTNSDGELYNRWMDITINQLRQNAFISDYSKANPVSLVNAKIN